MNRRKPRVIVFYGGPTSNFDLSSETGQWVCEYIPRAKYDVTPVEVTADGHWKVPLGNLPRSGSVKRAMEMLSQAIQPLAPSKALERLLDRPVDSLVTVVRGQGGDDGSLHSLGHALHIPVAGSPQNACQQTSNKHIFAQAVADITNTPYTRKFRKKSSSEEIIEEIREQFMPPFFVKPATQEGSFGIEYVESLDQLASAVHRARDNDDDLLLQEKLTGTEFSVTAYEDEQGKIHVLPTTVVVPQKTAFYDHMAKRRPGRVALHTPRTQDNAVLREAEIIARDIYEELGCSGLVTIDMMAHDTGIDTIEVNTIPTFTEMTPLKHQFKASGIHPTRVFDGIIRQSLNTR